MAQQSNPISMHPNDVALGSIENRNFLSPVGFKFNIRKMKGVEFFCQSASIPSISMQSANTATRFNKIPQPGDELTYEDLSIRFLVDENMKNWYQVHDWMREITTPYSSKEFGYARGTRESQNRKLNNRSDLANWDNQWRSDCSLFILSSNYQPVAEFVFKDAFPVNLSTLVFDSSVNDIQYFQADCSLRYTYYDYFIYEAATATDSSMPTNYRRSAEGVDLPLS